MDIVLRLQMLPIAGFTDSCSDSDVSCDSGASCRSDASCVSAESAPTAMEIY